MLTFLDVAHSGFGWAVAACLALSFTSAVLPWVNAELLVLALPALAGSVPRLALLVGVVTIGQMAGKCLVYQAGQRGLGTPTGANAARLERWRMWMQGAPHRGVLLVAISSAVGIPPFYVTSLLAGMLRLHLGWFVGAGTIGRLVRFSAIAVLPHLWQRAL